MYTIQKILQRFFIVLMMLMMCSCIRPTLENHFDPLEPLNRHVFIFNDALDKTLLKPTATAYRKAVPWPVRRGVRNFFANLAMIPTFANDLLQFEFKQAHQDAMRFVLNSTLGLAGTIDVATKVHIPEHFEDFGLTLAKWGIENSTYLVLPVFGPSTVRDTVGMGVDYFLSVYPYINNDTIVYSLMGLRFLQYRTDLLEADSIIESAAIDPYTFQRNAYLQHRSARLSKQIAWEEADPYLEEEDDDEENHIE